MGVGAYTSVLLTLHLGLPFALVLAAAALAPALVALVIAIPTLAPVGRLPRDRHHRARRGAAHPLPQHRCGGRRARHQRHPGEVELLDHLRPARRLRRPSRAGRQRSKIGRAFEAIREDEDAARVMGIDVARYKLVALVVSAAIAGVAGALNAHFSYFIGPNEFGFERAVSILSYAILGGISTPLGPVLGAFLLTALPEALRSVAGLPAGLQRAHHRAGGDLPAEGDSSAFACAGRAEGGCCCASKGSPGRSPAWSRSTRCRSRSTRASSTP